MPPDPVSAEDIYRVEDEQGNVTYSNTPPQTGVSAEVIATLPDPTNQDVEDARRRQREIEEEFSRLDRYRAEQEQMQSAARPNTTTTVVQNNTVIWGGVPLYGERFRPGAPLAPGAPTAPGFRPRPPHAVPLPARPYQRSLLGPTRVTGVHTSPSAGVRIRP